jgi:hypothetical protein
MVKPLRESGCGIRAIRFSVSRSHLLKAFAISKPTASWNDRNPLRGFLILEVVRFRRVAML